MVSNEIERPTSHCCVTQPSKVQALVKMVPIVYLSIVKDTRDTNQGFTYLPNLPMCNMNYQSYISPTIFVISSFILYEGSKPNDQKHTEYWEIK